MTASRTDSSCTPGLELQDRHNVFPVKFMGNTDYCGVRDPIDMQKDFFNRGWTDIDATSNNDVFLTAGDGERTMMIQTRPIPGRKTTAPDLTP